MNKEQPPQNENKSSEEKISGLFAMVRHHISHFLLGSRLSDNEWHVEQLEKSMQVVNELKQETQNQETKQRLNELLGKMQEVDTSGEVDRSLLNEIQERMEEVLSNKE